MELLELADEIERCLKRLEDFTSTPGEGVTRLPFTKESREALNYLKSEMEAAGLETQEDESGALYGHMEGRRKESVLIASHYDSVVHGGGFDGIAGIVCGIVIAKALKEEKIVPEFSIDVAALNDEEGVRFCSGYFSTKAMLGKLEEKDLCSGYDKNGITISQAMREWGKYPERIQSCARDRKNMAFMAEIHVEQGPVLEMDQAVIGIVDTIVGIRRFVVEIKGRADHAGTAPMDLRDDALVKAAPVVTDLRRAAVQKKDMTATVGEFQAFPGAVNIVPEKVRFTVDIRSSKKDDLDWAEEQLIKSLKLHCADSYEMVNTLLQEPKDMDHGLGQKAEEISSRLGYPFRHLNSGAGHDSLEAASVLPTLLLFVPSRAGRSHCPEEYSSPIHLAQASLVLKNMLISSSNAKRAEEEYELSQ